MRRHEISDNKWSKIKDFSPPQKENPKAAAQERATVRCSMRSSIGWTQGYPGVTCRNVMARGRAYTVVSVQGHVDVWGQILDALIAQDLVDGTTLMLDSTTVKVHQHGSGAKKWGITKRPDGAGEG